MPNQPPRGFGSRALVLTKISSGTVWFRFHGRQYANPLGFGYGPSRFSDPKIKLLPPKRYGVIYLGSTVKVCFAEAILRDQGDGRLGAFPIAWTEIETWTCATLRIEQTLNLVDLRGDGPIRMGIPSDVARARSQKLSRLWSRALWSHGMKPDGIAYNSRLNGESNIAIFDRALRKLASVATQPLTERTTDLTGIIEDFDLAIV